MTSVPSAQPAIAIGTVFGQLTTTTLAYSDGRGLRVACLCSCGRTYIANLLKIQDNKNASCRVCAGRRIAKGRNDARSKRTQNEPESLFDRAARRLALSAEEAT